ncbi:hypothetical protein A2755_00325 [Candidatus Wolfebacteria bacterium RIFCSPHIGHO2_01_FULL_48_22]|uniref:Cohesin domain-containing protein n=1 Tax=Candidatus Wolfebacteria bacterium RIFCSPHIGHO2_01_FULL_48_22 TaxID=1802555 RepID=A0A1F8DWY7_9BACT|nr:MAG: hypothetical protein A2755_00325 [Candidatus Wolfebacteria bacterium RIFCSPHIGHO2_01_FULL_48_22]
MRKYFYIGIAYIALFASAFGSAHAATLYFSPTTRTYNLSQTFTISVYVSAQEALNAVGGQIVFPQDTLQVVQVSKVGSILSIWATEPTFSNSQGTVDFEGIVPNPGFSGVAGKIISVTFRAQQTGTAHITVTKGSVLANDGQGTQILQQSQDLVLELHQQKIMAPIPSPTAIEPVYTLKIIQTDGTDPHPHMRIEGADLARIQSVRVKVGEGEFIDIAQEDVFDKEGFDIPRQAPGEHTVVVRIYTGDAEYIELTDVMHIEPLAPPKTVVEKKSAEKGQNVRIEVQTEPNRIINLFIRGKNKLDVLNQKANEKGFIELLWPTENVEADIYDIWARAYDDRGAESYESEPVSVSVTPQPLTVFFEKIGQYGIVTIASIAAAFILLFIAWYGWHLFYKFKRGFITQEKKAEGHIHKDFDDLKKAVFQQIKILQKIRKRRPLTQEEEQVVSYLSKYFERAEKEVNADIRNIFK